MDKNTAIIAGIAAVAIAAIIFLRPSESPPLLGSPAGRSSAGGNVGPDGYPLPEDRVLGVLERLTRLGGEVYDQVQSRRGTGARA